MNISSPFSPWQPLRSLRRLFHHSSTSSPSVSSYNIEPSSMVPLLFYFLSSFCDHPSLFLCCQHVAHLRLRPADACHRQWLSSILSPHPTLHSSPAMFCPTSFSLLISTRHLPLLLTTTFIRYFFYLFSLSSWTSNSNLSTSSRALRQRPFLIVISIF